MSTTNVKDSQGLEVVRFLDRTDEGFDTIMNRPLEDIEQRTVDLDMMMGPGRGFRVTETQPNPTNAVTVDEGWYLGEDDRTPYRFPDPDDARPDSIAIPAAGAGLFRIDLIVFDPHDATDALQRIPGSSQASWALAWTNRPRVPTAGSTYPLAYVYANDSTSTVYQDSIAVDNPGHIRDVRLSYGAGGRMFEDDDTVLQPDAATASLGDSTLTVRANHRHPANIDATLPETVEPDGVRNDGTSSTYAIADHRHAVPIETVAGNFLSDIDGGDAGSANKFAFADHRHPLRVQDVTPQPSNPTVAGDPGTSDYYSRLDHVHQVEDVELHAEGFGISIWNTALQQSAFISPVSFPYSNWQFMWLIWAGHHVNGTSNGGPHPASFYQFCGSGFGVYTPGMSSALSQYFTHGTDHEDYRAAIDVGGGSNTIVAGNPNHDNIGDVQPVYTNCGWAWNFSYDTTWLGFNVAVTGFSPDRIYMTPNVAIYAEIQGTLFAQGTS